MASNMLRDGGAEALQPAIATAGYILPTSKLETEKPNVIATDPEARPFDISFDIDPSPTDDGPPACPFTTIGGDFVISSPPPPSDLTSCLDVEETVTATAEHHQQKYEKRKLMRRKITDPVTGADIHGDLLIGDIYKDNNVLLALVVGPHGELGPMFKNFLFHYAPRRHLAFRADRPYATDMYARATTAPCPLGVVTSASIVWKRTRTRKFFGHSYTAPTPKEYTLGKLGLVITKAFAVHIRNANRKLGTSASPNAHCDTVDEDSDLPDPHDTTLD